MRLVLNIINYQVIWLLCVISGNRMVWLALLLIGGHLFFSNQRRNDLILIMSLALGGIIIDGSLKQLGLFSFSEDNYPIPYWLIIIWMALATLLNHSLNWLKGKYALAALLGSIGGPLAYWGGVRFDAAVFLWPLPLSLAVLMLIWGILTPLLLKGSDKINTSSFTDRR